MYLSIYDYDHTSRQLKTPSQDLKVLLLLVLGGLREQSILLIEQPFKFVAISPTDIL